MNRSKMLQPAGIAIIAGLNSGCTGTAQPPEIADLEPRETDFYGNFGNSHTLTEEACRLAEGRIVETRAPANLNASPNSLEIPTIRACLHRSLQDIAHLGKECEKIAPLNTDGKGFRIGLSSEIIMKGEDTTPAIYPNRYVCIARAADIDQPEPIGQCDGQPVLLRVISEQDGVSVPIAVCDKSTFMDPSTEHPVNPALPGYRKVVSNWAVSVDGANVPTYRNGQKN